MRVRVRARVRLLEVQHRLAPLLVHGGGQIGEARLRRGHLGLACRLHLARVRVRVRGRGRVRVRVRGQGEGEG